MVGLHAGGQQLGHGRSGRGDHGSGSAGGPGEPKGEEGGGTLIKGGVKHESPPLQQAGRDRQGGRTAARAENPMHQPGPQETTQKLEGGPEVRFSPIGPGGFRCHGVRDERMDAWIILTGPRRWKPAVRSQRKRPPRRLGLPINRRGRAGVGGKP